MTVLDVPGSFESGGAMEASFAESIYTGVFQKEIPAQICQLILHISNIEGLVDGFVWELIFTK